MDKEKVIDFVLIIVIIILGLYIGLNIAKDYSKVEYIDDEELYDVAVNYLIDEDSSNKKYYKLFIDYEGFGISKDSNYRYAYMIIARESHYVSNDKVVLDYFGCEPYRFIFSKEKDEVISYSTGGDGSDYKVSLLKMFPRDIRDKVQKYEMDYSKIDREVKDYYSKLGYSLD